MGATCVRECEKSCSLEETVALEDLAGTRAQLFSCQQQEEPPPDVGESYTDSEQKHAVPPVGDFFKATRRDDGPTSRPDECPPDTPATVARERATPLGARAHQEQRPKRNENSGMTASWWAG